MTMLFFVVFFFFSSRRRHTRSLYDWSSDVCSSDLKHANATRAEVVIGMRNYERFVLVRDNGEGFDGESPAAGQGLKNIRARSEERRVGKECRSRWWRYQ